MNLRELLDELNAIVKESPEALDYELYTCDGRLGTSDELSYPSIETRDGNYPDGVVQDLPLGTKYISFSVGN